jgi:methylmalonyl-CoA mutase
MTDLKLGSNFGSPSQDDWLAAVETALRGKAAESLVSQDLAGFTRQPLYTNANAPSETSGMPGFAPFTRGPQAVNNTYLPWHIAQRAVIGRKGVDNAALLTDLQGGVTALWLDFSQGAPEAGTVKTLLKGVRLDLAPLCLVPHAHGMAAVQPVLDYYDQQDAAPETVGYLNLDPLAASLEHGEIDALDYAALPNLSTSRPGLRWMTSSGAAYHAHGASVPQELGWMLAGLTDYMRELETVGVSPGEALSKITLTVAADVDFFATLAKIRAARLLFANIAEAVGAPDTPPQIHAESSLRAFADVDPWVNILRATAATMGAGIAGVDVMCVAPCTATSANDSTLTRRIARNTQVILQEESHIGQVTDAAGGSFYVEQLTHDLATSAWQVFQDIEATGGLCAALAEDRIGDAIRHQRAAFDAAIDTRAHAMVGVSEFPNLDEAPLETSASGQYRLSHPFEALRKAAQKSKPKVFLACVGDMASYTPRANFATNLYAAGGLHAVAGDGGTDFDAIAEAFKKSNAKIAVLCGSDADYETHASALAAALKGAGVVHLALAGNPRDLPEVDDYCFAGCKAFSYLANIHMKLGL